MALWIVRMSGSMYFVLGIGDPNMTQYKLHVIPANLLSASGFVFGHLCWSSILA